MRLSLSPEEDQIYVPAAFIPMMALGMKHLLVQEEIMKTFSPIGQGS
jgi:hypothetical protein